MTDKYAAAMLFQALMLRNGAQLEPPDKTMFGFEPASVFYPFRDCEAIPSQAFESSASREAFRDCEERQ